MNNDSKYWESLKGIELEAFDGGKAFVAAIDPAIGFSIIGLEDGEEWWCDSPNEIYACVGTYEEHFDFALNCILAGISPSYAEFKEVFPERKDLDFIEKMLAGVGECPF